jgi:uncharacterized membrane protein
MDLGRRPYELKKYIKVRIAKEAYIYIYIYTVRTTYGALKEQNNHTSSPKIRGELRQIGGSSELNVMADASCCTFIGP